MPTSRVMTVGEESVEAGLMTLTQRDTRDTLRAPERRGRAVKGAGLVALAMLTSACAYPTAPATTPTTTRTVTTVGPIVEVVPAGHADTYRRDAFGRRWRDVDRDGCDQRNDVLARDLTGVARRGRCVVVSGHLVDPYTGVPVDFTKAHATAVQIDHRVALAEAWRSGAWAWTPAEREAFANDLSNLIATAGPVNQAKSDHDAAEWAPRGAEAGCVYARAVEATKVRYRLSVDVAEAKALRRLLDGCRR